MSAMVILIGGPRRPLLVLPLLNDRSALVTDGRVLFLRSKMPGALFRSPEDVAGTGTGCCDGSGVIPFGCKVKASVPASAL